MIDFLAIKMKSFLWGKVNFAKLHILGYNVDIM